MGLEVAKTLAARGHRLAITFPEPGLLDEEAAAIPAEIFLADTRRSVNLGASRRIAAFCRRLGVDCMYTHLGMAGEIVAGFAARLAGVPLVIHRHAIPHFSPQPAVRAYQIAAYRRIVRSAAGLISVSGAVRGAMDAGEWSPANHERVPNAPLLPPPENETDPAAFRATVPGDGPLVGLIGRLSRENGVEDLIAATPIVRAGCPEVRFVVAGDGSEPGYLDRLVAMAAEAGVGGTVHFLGFRCDVATILRALDVVVIPSHSEGMPLRLLDAMAAGRPIVATDIPGIREVVADGGTALMVPPRDPQGLAAAISELLAHPDEAARIGRKGQQVVRERFDPAAMLGRCADLVELWGGR